MELIQSKVIVNEVLKKYYLNNQFNISDISKFIDICNHSNFQINGISIGNFETSPYGFSKDFSSIAEFNNYVWDATSIVDHCSIFASFNKNTVSFNLDFGNNTVHTIQSRSDNFDFSPVVSQFELCCQKKTK